MQNKLVSIVMATYNGEKFLREQLDSIYSQTYKNMEVVVCDDCSTDSTVEILEEYKQKYCLKYYINEKNLGYTKNFEKAASLCKGEFIAFSDQDDIWFPEKIETLLRNIENNLLIFSDALVINSNKEIICNSRYDYMGNLENVKPKYYHDFIKKNVLGCTILINKNLLNYALPFKKTTGHDNWLISIAIKLNSIIFTDKQLIKYRIHGGNVSGTVFKNTPTMKIKNYLRKNFTPVYTPLRSIYWNFKSFYLDLIN